MDLLLCQQDHLEVESKTKPIFLLCLLEFGWITIHFIPCCEAQTRMLRATSFYEDNQHRRGCVPMISCDQMKSQREYKPLEGKATAMRPISWAPRCWMMLTKKTNQAIPQSEWTALRVLAESESGKPLLIFVKTMTEKRKINAFQVNGTSWRIPESCGQWDVPCKLEKSTKSTHCSDPKEVELTSRILWKSK